MLVIQSLFIRYFKPIMVVIEYICFLFLKNSSMQLIFAYLIEGKEQD